MPTLNVYPLPELIQPDALAESTCVVIDVLRATTTMVYALGAGARAIVPCLSIDDAREAAERLPCGQTLLAGERGGLAIPSFDLGNSPGDFNPATVQGKFVVLTTTNGTKALLHCRPAPQVLAGAFANLSALCSTLAACERVGLVCAGTDGEPTEEDLLLAGAIVERLESLGDWRLDDAARAVRRGWHSIAGRATDDELAMRVAAAMLVARGGRNLASIGLERDVELAACADAFDVVPRFDAASGRITPSPSGRGPACDELSRGG